MQLLIHELVHVEQYQSLGSLQFSCQYGGLIAEDFDSNNELERPAERVENAFVTELTTSLDAACVGRVPDSSVIASPQSDWFWMVWG